MDATKKGVMRILHLEYDQYPAESKFELESCHEVEAYFCHTQADLYEKLSKNQYDCIFMRLGLSLDRKAMNLQPVLKYVITPTTGITHIDTEAALEKGITVVSLKGESSFLSTIKSTAEHTWALLLTLIRRMAEARESVLQGEWKRELFLCDELSGKKLGIIGYGRLGKIIGKYGISFGMEVFASDQDDKAFAEKESSVLQVDLNKLLQTCDYIILLISYSKENENFMNTARFGQMKRGVYFVNTSRGELVDEQALLDGLQTGLIKGAALDVLRNDSAWPGRIESSHSLLAYAKTNYNLLITPHLGGYGRESTQQTKKFIVRKFLSLT
jgi:D-3-phosphoglycerate dehydrogenase